MNNKGNVDNMIKNNDKRIVLGIDIGGTTCKCGVFTTDGELLYKDEIATRKDEGGSLILSDIKNHIPDMLSAAGMKSDDVAGVGIGVPGAVKMMEQLINVLILDGVCSMWHRHLMR